MNIESLTKALYFLNATEYKHSVTIERIEHNVIHFSNRHCINVDELANDYDNFIKNGQIAELW